jgi:hypothetical protein
MSLEVVVEADDQPPDGSWCQSRGAGVTSSSP